MASGKSLKSTWKCPHHCPNDKVACPHLEALLNREVGQGLHRNLRYMSDISILPHQVKFDYGTRSVTHREERAFKANLAKAGLIREEIDFMVEMFVRNRSIREIALELGFTSKSTAGYFYRKIKQKLKQQGFALRRANNGRA